MIDFENELNAEQLRVVQAINGRVACVAAAGSGKTRCIIYRIANILLNGHATPNEIVVVTFTNKAAEEIKQRLTTLIPGLNLKKMLIGTFHSICIKLIHRYCPDYNFNILTDHKLNLIIEEIIEKKHFKNITAQELTQYIALKESTINNIDKFWFQDIDPEFEVGYQEYENISSELNAISFNRLILKGLELFDDEATKFQIQNNFKYVMVDEYQDSNGANDKLTQLLSGYHKNLMVVGDDYQSIYGWRYADVDIFMQFVQTADTVLYLTTNYRSNQTIVKASKAVIDHNEQQLHKSINAISTERQDIQYYKCWNDERENLFCIQTIQNLIKQGYEYKDIMILTRSHNTSLNLEYYLVSADIPYTLSNETNFIDRFEIRLIANMLFFLSNPHDIVSFLELAEHLTSNVGKATRIKLYDAVVYLYNKPILDIIDEELDNIPRITSKAKESLRSLAALLKNLMSYQSRFTPRQYAAFVIRNSPLLKIFNNNDNYLLGIKEFLMYAQIVEEENEDIRTTSDLINYIYLKAAENFTSDKVRILTVHSSKGLEAKNVIIIGCDEGIFPSVFCQTQKQIEEERRLFYVAMTRAKDNLFLVHTKRRKRFDKTYLYQESRFIKEIPKEMVQIKDETSN